MEKLTSVNFADLAEKAIKSLIYEDNRHNKKMDLTTSKIRNLLSMTNAIYNKTLHQSGDTISSELQHDVQYLKMRFAYEAGREPRVVKPFIEKSNIREYIDNIGDSKSALILFCNYMESLVAYHKFYGGRD